MAFLLQSISNRDTDYLADNVLPMVYLDLSLLEYEEA